MTNRLMKVLVRKFIHHLQIARSGTDMSTIPGAHRSVSFVDPDVSPNEIVALHFDPVWSCKREWTGFEATE